MMQFAGQRGAMGFLALAGLILMVGMVNPLLTVQPPATMLILDDIICEPPMQNSTNATQASSTSAIRKLQDFCSNKNFTVILRGTPFSAYSPLTATGLPTAMQFSNLTNFFRMKIIVEDFTAKPSINKEILDNTVSSFNPVQKNDSGTRTWRVTIPETNLPSELNCTLAFVHVLLYQDKAMVANLSSNQLLHPHFPLPGIRDVMSIALPISGVQCGVELVGNVPPTDLALQGQTNTTKGLDWWIDNILPDLSSDEDGDEDDGPVFQPLLFGTSSRGKRSPQFGNRPPPPPSGQNGGPQRPPMGMPGQGPPRPSNSSGNFSNGFPPPPPGGNFSGFFNGSFNGSSMPFGMRPPMAGNMSGFEGMMGRPGGNMSGFPPPPGGNFSGFLNGSFNGSSMQRPPPPMSGNMTGNFSLAGQRGPPGMGNQSINGSMGFRPPPPQSGTGQMGRPAGPGAGGPPGGMRAFASGLEGTMGSRPGGNMSGFSPPPPGGNFSGMLNGSFNGTSMQRPPQMSGNMTGMLPPNGMRPPSGNMSGNMTGMGPPNGMRLPSGNMSGNFSLGGQRGPPGMGNQSINGSMGSRPPPPQSGTGGSGQMGRPGGPGPGGPPGGLRAFAADSSAGVMDNRTFNGSMARPPMDNRTMNGSRMPPGGPPTGQRNAGPPNTAAGTSRGGQMPPRSANGTQSRPAGGSQQSGRGGDSGGGERAKGFSSYGTSGQLYNLQNMPMSPSGGQGSMGQQGSQSQESGRLDDDALDKIKENLQANGIPVYQSAEEFFSSRTLNISLANLGPSSTQSRNLLGAVSIMAYIRRLTPRTLDIYDDATSGGNGTRWNTFSEGDILIETDTAKLLNGRNPNALPVGSVLPLNFSGIRLPSFACGPLLLIVEIVTFADKNSTNNWFQQPFFLDCGNAGSMGEGEKPCQPLMGPIIPGTSKPAGLYVRSNLGPGRDPDFTAIRFEPEMAETSFQNLAMGDRERRMAVVHDARVKMWMQTLANSSMCNGFTDETNAMNFPAAAVLFIDAVSSALQSMSGVSNQVAGKTSSESNSTEAFKRFMQLVQERRCPERVKALDDFMRSIIKGTIDMKMAMMGFQQGSMNQSNGYPTGPQPQMGSNGPQSGQLPGQQQETGNGEGYIKAVVDAMQKVAQSGGNDTICVLTTADKEAIMAFAGKITADQSPMILDLFFSILMRLTEIVDNAEAPTTTKPDINAMLVQNLAGILLANEKFGSNSTDFTAIARAVNGSQLPDATFNLMHLLWWSRHDWQFIAYGKRNNNGSGSIGRHGNGSEAMEVCYQKAQLMSRLLQIGKTRNFRTRMLWKTENGIIHAGSYSTLMSDIFWVPIFACSCPSSGGCGQQPVGGCGRGRGDGRKPTDWNNQGPMSGNMMNFGNLAGQGNMLPQLSAILGQLSPAQQSQLAQMAMAMLPALLASSRNIPNQMPGVPTDQQQLLASMMGQSTGNADYAKQLLTQLQSGASAGNPDMQRMLQQVQTAMSQQQQAMKDMFAGMDSATVQKMMSQMPAGLQSGGSGSGSSPPSPPTPDQIANFMNMMSSSGSTRQSAPSGIPGSPQAVQEAANQMLNNFNFLLG